MTYEFMTIQKKNDYQKVKNRNLKYPLSILLPKMTITTFDRYVAGIYRDNLERASNCWKIYICRRMEIRNREI